MNTDESQSDTTAKSAAQAVGPITREQLYELVWTKPMLRVGEMFGVSSSYMARVCTELRVPRPGLGYWTQHEMGRAPQRAALPPAEPGDLTVWKPGLSVGNTQRVARKQVAAAPTAGGQSVHRPGRSSKKAALPSVHPLLKDVKPLFLKSREKSTGLLHPFKRIFVDIISSPALLDDALATANALFLALTKRGHRVMLAPGHLQMRRADVSIREVQEPNSHHEAPWSFSSSKAAICACAAASSAFTVSSSSARSSATAVTRSRVASRVLANCALSRSSQSMTSTWVVSLCSGACRVAFLTSARLQSSDWVMTPVGCQTSVESDCPTGQP